MCINARCSVGMLILRVLVLLFFVGGSSAQTCAVGQFFSNGSQVCTFYHLDPDLRFWFKYNLKDIFIVSGSHYIKHHGVASAYVGTLYNWIVTISTFAKRGEYSVKSYSSLEFPPQGPWTESITTSLPLPWSNKAITYTYWIHAKGG